MPRRFFLDNIDSGARVGEGVCFSDGAVALRLTGRVPATIVHQSVEGMLHRHALTSESVQWVDPPAVETVRA
jgi:hypothetical protein